MVEKNRPAYYKPTKKSEVLRELLQESVTSKRADVLLLSGGIDSSVLAALDRNVPAYTTSLKGSSEKFDLRFAGKVAKHLKLDWTPVVVTWSEAIENLRPIMRIRESYDTAILNDLALYIAINRAMDDLNIRAIRVRSGEPADMLFRGYVVTYEKTQDELNFSIDKQNPTELPLNMLERKTQVSMDYPYLDPKIKKFAKQLSHSDTVLYRSIPGDVWSTHRDNPERLTAPPYPFGKLVLRQTMIDILPQEVSLRSKTDIQFGSGTDALRAILRGQINPIEIAEFEGEGFRFRNVEHAALYKIYRQEGLKPKPPIRGKENECASCHGGVKQGSMSCDTCGAYPYNIHFDQLRNLRSTIRHQNK